MRAAVDEISMGTLNPDDYSYPRTPEDMAFLDGILEDAEANGGC